MVQLSVMLGSIGGESRDPRDRRRCAVPSFIRGVEVDLSDLAVIEDVVSGEGHYPESATPS